MNDQFNPLGQSREDIDTRIQIPEKKVYATFDGTNTGTFEPEHGEGILNIIRTAAGTYTVNFITPLMHTEYSVLSNSSDRLLSSIDVRTYDSFRVRTETVGGVLTDANEIHILVLS